MSQNVHGLVRAGRVAAIVLALGWASGCGEAVTEDVDAEACGDGLVSSSEGCDDANTAPRDGCDELCRVEGGWVCEGAPSVCERSGVAGFCGDGTVSGDEGCDDGNGRAGDGCDRACAIETGWRCLGSPSRCTEAAAACGDGFVDDGEGCDDANETADDGCTACAADPGFVCTGAPSVCAERAGGTCGDEFVDRGESCDDGNADAGDGCDAACAAERGFRCVGNPSVCEAIPARCGDGLVALRESCDDGNDVDGDGCDRGCFTEDGWVCAGEPSACRRGTDICAELDCSSLTDGCTAGRCNVRTGACEAVPAPDATACEDDDLCTQTGVCAAGACVPGPTIDCSALNDGCQRGVCDPEAGGCVPEPIPDGESCDFDATDCSTAVCVEGACVASEAPTCTPCGDGTQLCGGGVCGGSAARTVYPVDGPALDAALVSTGGSAWTTTTDRPFAGAGAARSGAIGARGRSSMTLAVTVASPATVAFMYRTSSEGCCDKLAFFVNGTERGSWGGEIGWTRTSYSLPAGSHTLEWRYAKDGSVTEGEDAAFVDEIEVVETLPACSLGLCETSAVFDGASCVVCGVIEDGTVCEETDGCGDSTCVGGDCVRTPAADGAECDTDPSDCVEEICADARCIAVPRSDCETCGDGSQLCGGGVCGGVNAGFEEGFEAAALPARFASPTPAWSVTSTTPRAGASALRSGAIGNNSTSRVSTSVTLRSAGEIAFWYRTSTESCCDKLRFLIDGVELGNWGDASAWTRAAFPVAAGTHTLEWRYTKDVNTASGDDAVYIDDVVLTEAAAACDSVECASVAVYNGDRCVMCEPADDGLTCGTADVCGSYACDDGSCSARVPVANGTTCGAADACGVFQCVDGGCERVPLADGTTCGAPDACGVYQCFAGGCQRVALANGASCDANPADCIGATCQAGACVTATLPDCASCGDGTQRCGAGVCGGPPASRSEGFEAGTIGPWATTSSPAWTITTAQKRSGNASARSADIGHSRSTSMQLSVTLTTAGAVSFWYRTSTEFCSSSPCDYLEFFVDDVSRSPRWGGNIGWTNHTVPLAAGTRRLEWRYTKDINTIEREDAVYVDDIDVSGLSVACSGTVCAPAQVSLGNSCAVCTALEEGTGCGGTTCFPQRCRAGICTIEPVAECTP